MSTVLAALALREAIGETEPGGDRRLCFVWTLYASRFVLADPPMRDAVGERLLEDMLCAYDAEDDEPADVVGPLFVDYPRAVELAERYGAEFGGVNLARDELESLTHRNWLVVAAGAHRERT